MHYKLPLFISFIASCGTSSVLFTTTAVTSVGPLQPGGRMGLHGMVVFGGQASLFMSHIPMFQSPHDFQAIFQVTLPITGRDFSDALYTFKPNPFSLNDALLGTLKTMHGTLFEGNFESGGQPMQDLTVTIEQTVTATQLVNNAVHPTHLEYVVLGHESDTYLFHPVTYAGDFDQILKVSIDPANVSAEDLARGLTLIFADRQNTVDHRLAPGQITAHIKDTGDEVSLDVERVLSVLVGPHFTDAP